MPSVGEASRTTTTTTHMINNMSNDDWTDEQQGRPDGKISRVTKLRDMFQNGIVRPIEEIDNVVPFEETLPECDRVHHQFSNFSRSFPGSPPLSALRAQRFNLNVNPSVTNCSSSSFMAPPIRPPKPRHLWVDKSSPTSAAKHNSRATSLAAVTVSPTGKDHNLKACIQMFENGPSSTSSSLHSGKTSRSSLSSTPPIVIEPEKLELGGLINAPATFPAEVTASVSITPTLCAARGHINTPTTKHSPVDVNSSPPRGQGNHAQDAEASTPDASMYHTPAGRLSSWHDIGALHRISSQPNQHSHSEDCQQFIVQSDSFQSEDSHLSNTATPLLQHAEPIAVGSVDEDDDEEQEEEEELILLGNDVQPTLPVPNGLRVVMVNQHGVHILEDGNFFYSAPWLLNEEDTVEEDDDPLFIRPTAPRTSLGSPKDNGSASMALSLQLHHGDDDDNDAGCVEEEKKPRVRFSSNAVLVYSTYSIFEYNRRNEDIDPLGASAEYELEKHLESMDLVTVDLRKSPLGLGFSILGLGVDQFGGSQKLGIFIKLLTPGGAAELDGRIKIYDQIVEVDGVSLVGVASEFAAATLRGTKEIVQFSLAREKDPENSRVAKLLRQQEREQNMADDDRHLGDGDEASNEEVPTGASNKLPNTSSTPEECNTRLHRDDSLDTLQRHMNALGSANPSVEDDDYEDGGSGGPLEFTANPLFVRLTDEPDQSSPPAHHPALPPFSSSPNATCTPPAGAASPRSALKGTATAASTQRREEAIALLIQLATNEVKNSSPFASSANPEEAPDWSDHISRCLAINLHDCHGILVRQRDRLRSMEQRLTAQEAAADEAIERLCLQCRHLEAELVRTSEQLRPCRRQHSPAGHRPSQSTVGSQSVVESVHTNGGFKQSIDSCQPSSVNGNHVTSTATPTLMETLANPDQHSPKLLSGQQAAGGLSSGQPIADKCLSTRPRGPLPSGDHKQRDQVTATTSDDDRLRLRPAHLQQVQARLHVSCGLINRRPPTRVVVDPPFQQDQDSSLYGLPNPPLIETTSQGTSYAPSRDDQPARSPTKNKPLDPRPLPANYLHRSQQQTSLAFRSSSVSNSSSNHDVERDLRDYSVKSTLTGAVLPGVISRFSPNHQLPPIGLSSTPTLNNSTPVSSCHMATSERVSPLRRVTSCNTPPKSIPSRPQPIRTPGHPTPLQLQQQNWQSHQAARTSSAPPSSTI